MNVPNLHALQIGDSEAWDAVFDWLWPVVFAVAHLKLHQHCPDEVEDIAIESLEELVEKVAVVKSVHELKPLAASIAHHRAVGLLRKRFAKKRGAGKTESLAAPKDNEECVHVVSPENSPLENVERMELVQQLNRSLAELKAPLGEILSDFFLHGLRYEEIAQKRCVAIGSVGVYLRRGLEIMRRIWGAERRE